MNSWCLFPTNIFQVLSVFFYCLLDFMLIQLLMCDQAFENWAMCMQTKSFWAFNCHYSQDCMLP